MTKKSSRNPELSDSKLLHAIRFSIDQRLKALNIARPGIIKEYDAETRRAKVEIGIDRLLNDGELVRPAPLADVPVLFPSGGGYVCHLPLAAGDPVMLLFSDRGLTEWKRLYAAAAPDRDAIFDARDALAIPGFGPLSQELPETEGAYLGRVAGDEYVSIKPGELKLVGSAEVKIIAADEILLDGPVRITGSARLEDSMRVDGASSLRDDLDVTGDIDVSGEVDGVDVSAHAHTLVQPGSGKSGPPG